MSCGAIRDRLEGAGIDDSCKGKQIMGFVGNRAYIKTYIAN